MISRACGNPDVLHGFQEVVSELQVILHDRAVTTRVSMDWSKIEENTYLHHIIKTVVNLCSGRHEVLLNSKHNHIEVDMEC